MVLAAEVFDLVHQHGEQVDPAIGRTARPGAMFASLR